MSKSNPAALLADMIEAIEQMGRFTLRYDARSFAEDDMTVQAVCRCLEILTETAVRTPEPLRQRFPGIPWSRLAGLHPRLIRAYFDVDRDLLWKIVADDVPPLLPQLRAILDQTQAEARA